MANRVDPDQTAPSSLLWVYTVCDSTKYFKKFGSALFAYAIFWETLVYGILGYLPHKLQMY